MLCFLVAALGSCADGRSNSPAVDTNLDGSADRDPPGDADVEQTDTDEVDGTELGDGSGDGDVELGDTDTDHDTADDAEQTDAGPDTESGPPDADIGGETVDAGEDAETTHPPDGPCDRARATRGDTTPRVLAWVDVTSEAGLGGVQSELVPTLGESVCGEEAVFTGGAAVGDFDDDGDLDIFLTRLRLPDQLYRNEGDGTFAEIAGDVGLDSTAAGNAAAWVDVDADGDLDLFVSTIADEPNHLWIQDDDGTWADEAEARGLALGGEEERPDACGHFTGVAFADADEDGDLDATIGRWISRGRTWRVNLMRNDGTGRFTDATTELGLVADDRSVVFTPAWYDFDSDGDRDVLLTADFGTSRYFENTDGGLVESTADRGLGSDQNGMGSAVADFDGDGDPDVFVTSIYGETREECSFSWGCTGNRLYLNDGSGRFTDCTEPYGVRDGGWGWGAAWFDPDLDGDLDLAQTGGYWPHWEDTALDRFREASERFRDGGLRFWQAGPHRPWTDSSADSGLVSDRRGRAMVAFDFDRDGDDDLLVTHNAQPPMLFETTGAEGRRWLAVRLRAPAPNPFGVGAVVRVRLADAGPWMRREVVLGGGYLGAGPLEVRFGLGDHEGAVRTLRVEWPSGDVTELADVDPDQVLTVWR